MRKTDKITNGTKATFYAEWLKQQLRMIEELIKLLISIRWKSHEVLLVSKVECGRMLIRKRLSILYEGKYKQFLMVTKDFQRNRVKKMQQKGHLVLTKE